MATLYDFGVHIESRYEPHPNAEAVPLGSGAVRLPSPGTLTVPNSPRVGVDTKIDVHTDGVRLHIDAVTVQTQRDDDSVQALDIRGIKTQELIRAHLPRYVIVNAFGWKFPASEDVASALRAAGPVMTTLLNVAQTYGFARAIGLPPAKAVQDSYGLTRDTASRWIRRAREVGYIEDEG